MKELAELMTEYMERNQLSALEGTVATVIPGVSFYRNSNSEAKAPFIYESGLIILGQGHKKITMGSKKQVTYGPNDYLVAGVPMPLECESFGTKEKPILGLSIRIDQSMLLRQVNQLNEYGWTNHECSHDNCGMKSVAMDAAMLNSCKRMMNALLNPMEARLLADALLEEMLFRVLTGREGHLLFNLARYEGHYARVAKALSKVHRDYGDNLSVQALALEANMSVSAFHQAFRQITMESPLQYLKKVRLNKARELIQVEGRRVNDAARLVGYSSPSQFSREYKRHFNQTPKGRKLA